MILDHLEHAGHEQVVFVRDDAAGLKAIIAVHDTTLGPALGGCRMWPYADEAAALADVLRLSRGMTAKAALAEVPFGGGKMVVLGEPARDRTPALLRAIGRAIERLGGRYVTGEDVGTTEADMVEIRRETAHVLGLPAAAGGPGDPSPSTALGCLAGIQASLRHALGSASLTGVRVALQGLGQVGMQLCALLHEAGARLIVADTRDERAAEAMRRFGARVVAPEAILGVEAEVLAPCALGAVIDDTTLPRLRVRIVAGAANNQLAAPRHGPALAERGVLYAPDYVINAGGMIRLACAHLGQDAAAAECRVRAIHHTLLRLYRLADGEGIAASAAAERMVEDRLRAARAALTASAA